MVFQILEFIERYSLTTDKDMPRVMQMARDNPSSVQVMEFVPGADGVPSITIVPFSEVRDLSADRFKIDEGGIIDVRRDGRWHPTNYRVYLPTF